MQDTINGSAFTLEMVVDDYILYGNSFGTLLSSENDSFSVFHRASNGVWEFKNGNNQNRPKLNDAAALLQGSTVSIVFTAGAESTVYVNGEAAASWTPAGVIGASGWMRLGHDDDTRKFEAVFRSVRLYDRALSQEEVQANYACDALERSGSLDASFQEQASGTALDLSFENGSAQVPFSLHRAGELHHYRCLGRRQLLRRAYPAQPRGGGRRRRRGRPGRRPTCCATTCWRRTRARISRPPRPPRSCWPGVISSHAAAT